MQAIPPFAGNTSWSMKRSYLEVIESIRSVFGRTKVMMMNSLGAGPHNMDYPPKR